MLSSINIDNTNEDNEDALGSFNDLVDQKMEPTQIQDLFGVPALHTTELHSKTDSDHDHGSATHDHDLSLSDFIFREEYLHKVYKTVENRLCVSVTFVTTASDSVQKIQQKLEDTHNKLYVHDKLMDIVQADYDSRYMFRWDQQNSDKFAAIALAMGIKTVTPSEILIVMNNPELNQQKVASHLQKLRLVIAKENKITVSQLNNHHMLKNCRSKRLQLIKERWKQKDFDGFSIQDVCKMFADEK